MITYLFSFLILIPQQRILCWLAISTSLHDTDWNTLSGISVISNDYCDIFWIYPCSQYSYFSLHLDLLIGPSQPIMAKILPIMFLLSSAQKNYPLCSTLCPYYPYNYCNHVTVRTVYIS